MRKKAYYIVNAITFYRLAAAPLLMVLLWQHAFGWFRVLLCISFFTDAIDGYLARRHQVVSVFGARLDSVADDVTILVAIAGILVYRPAFLKEEYISVIQMVTLFIIQTAAALIKYGKTTSFHTYAAKAAAVLQGLFLLTFFFLPQPVYPLFAAMVVVTTYDLLEEIILVMLLPEWKTNVKGLYWVLKKEKPGNSGV